MENTGRPLLTFRDTGPGFSEEAIQKAMDPFFTTKDSGTGLGLPIVQAIIESHGGTMKLSNAPEGGAVIRIEFPSPSSHSDKNEGSAHE
jgi:signal transduction histidine kinase